MSMTLGEVTIGILENPVRFKNIHVYVEGHFFRVEFIILLDLP